MKIIGYIKPYKENSFSIPIYSEGNNYYYHKLNGDFIILDFEIANINIDLFVKCKNKKANINDKGFIIFNSEFKVVIGNSKNTINLIFSELKKSKLPIKYIMKEVTSASLHYS